MMACLKRKLTISVHDSRWEQKNDVARGAATLLALQLSGQVGEGNHLRPNYSRFGALSSLEWLTNQLIWQI